MLSATSPCVSRWASVLGLCVRTTTKSVCTNNTVREADSDGSIWFTVTGLVLKKLTHQTLAQFRPGIHIHPERSHHGGTAQVGLFTPDIEMQTDRVSVDHLGPHTPALYANKHVRQEMTVRVCACVCVSLSSCEDSAGSTPSLWGHVTGPHWFRGWFEG